MSCEENMQRAVATVLCNKRGRRSGSTGKGKLKMCTRNCYYLNLRSRPQVAAVILIASDRHMYNVRPARVATFNASSSGKCRVHGKFSINC